MGDFVQSRVALPSFGKLASETPMLPIFPDACQTDAEGLENPTEVSLKNLAQPVSMRPHID